MPYDPTGTLTTDERDTAVSESWDTQTDWEAYQSISNIEIENGILQLSRSIPDSAVRQWPFVERSDSTIFERLVGDDGSVYGSPTNTTDASFFEGYYEATDGTDDAILLPIGEFETQIQSKDWGIAFTVRGDVDFLDGQTNLAGAASSNFTDSVDIDDTSPTGTATADDGRPMFRIRQNSNNAIIESSTPLDDNSIHRIFWHVSSDDPSNWDVYVDDTDDSPSVTADEGIDASQIDLSSDINNFALSARNFDGTIQRFGSMDIDHPILYDSPSRQDITDDYLLQPFA